MNKYFSRLFSALVILVLIISLFSGCGTAQNSGTTQSTSAAQTAQQTTKAAEPLSLTYWVPLAPDVAAKYTNLGDTPLYKELEKRTGVHVKFLHPPVGQETDQFNLMIASKDIPDVIETNWINFPGGPEKAISDGILIKINDYLAKDTPNLKQVLDSDKTADKLVKTDNGTYYGFPYIKSGEEDGFTTVWYGPQIRKDWLDQVSLPLPETIDEWTSMLIAFRDKLKVPNPFSVEWKRLTTLTVSNAFASAYGAGFDFFQQNGQVVYGPIQPGYKDFLTLFNSWYKDKLLDPDFAAQDRKTLDAKITDGKVGSYMGNAAGHMGKYLSIMENDKQFNLTGAKYPVLKKGDMPSFGQMDFRYDTNCCAGITTVNKHPEETAKWLDYGYSKEGCMLFNFGIEGESFNMVDGKPMLADIVTKNPDGLTLAQSWVAYARVVYNGPFVEDVRAIHQLFPFQQSVDAISQWVVADHSTQIPTITPTPEESAALATTMNEITTYVNEMTLKFIMGQEPISNFDIFTEQVKKMGIDNAIKIKQDALERFNNR